MLDLFLTGGEVLVQTGTDIDTQFGAGQSLFGSGVSAFFTTLVVGALLLAFVPDYTEQKVGEIFDDPVGPFLYGVVSLLVLVVLIVVLVLTVVGILVVIPLVMLAVALWAVGISLALLAIADRLVGHENGWVTPLVVAAIINAGLAISGVGWLLSFVLGAIGFGTVLHDFVG